jgi:hypothetical protein
MAERKLVGHLHLDSAQILILEPTRLDSEAEYQRVVEVTLEKGAGEVWLRDGAVETTSDGVVVETGNDGEFPVYVEYHDDGVAKSIHIDLA